MIQINQIVCFNFQDLDKVNDNCFSIVFRLVTIVEQGSCKSWWISLKHRLQGNVKQHRMISVIYGLSNSELNIGYSINYILMYIDILGEKEFEKICEIRVS